MDHILCLPGPLDLQLACAVRYSGQYHSRNARDTVRRLMNVAKPDDFPYVPNTTSIERISVSSRSYAIGKQFCSVCGSVDPCDYGMLESYMSAGLSGRENYPDGVEMQDWMEPYLTYERRACGVCQENGMYHRLTITSTLRDVPPIVLRDVIHDSLIFSESLSFDGAVVSLKLGNILCRPRPFHL
jgi:hypothetical protein